MRGTDYWSECEDRILAEMIGAGCTLDDVSRAVDRPFWGVRARYDRLVAAGKCQYTRKSSQNWDYKKPSRDVQSLIDMHKRSYARDFADKCEGDMKSGKRPLLELAFLPRLSGELSPTDVGTPPSPQPSALSLPDSGEFSANFFD